ncbi:MAG: GerMN domain-containing protein [Desulfobacterales bacterium]|nr:GerMN domain-containing protein [Desulfobacterales bacterium]
MPTKPRCIAYKIFVAAIVGSAFAVFFQDVRAEPSPASPEEAQLPADIRERSKKSAVHLYFSDRKNFFLMSEQRLLLHRDSPASLAQAIIEALIKGPQEGLVRTIPSETMINAVYIADDGICYVDLSEAISKNHPGGSQTELLTVYSIVNSLILNIPEIERVKILIKGKEALTVAGHIDLQFPVKANMLLIR